MQLKLKRFNEEQVQKIVVGFILLMLCVFFSVTSPYFFKVNNLMTIALQSSITMICAFGMTFDIIAGAIDLSLGSTVALSGCITTLALRANVPMFVAIILGLSVGLVVGFINGMLVAKFKIPPFITTLAAQMYIRGIAMVITNAQSIFVKTTDSFKKIATTYIFEFIPLPVILMLVVACITGFILKKTVIGRQMYAVGSNEEAARLSGISIVRVRIAAYMCSAVCACIAGIIFAARVNSGQPSIGVGYEGTAVASAVIGGASMAGGHGSISGTMLGAFVMAVLMNGLNLLNVSQNWQNVATGLVLILAVLIDRMRSQRSRKSK